MIANVTSSLWEAQLCVINDGVMQLLLYLAMSQFKEVQVTVGSHSNSVLIARVTGCK